MNNATKIEAIQNRAARFTVVEYGDSRLDAQAVSLA